MSRTYGWSIAVAATLAFAAPASSQQIPSGPVGMAPSPSSVWAVAPPAAFAPAPAAASMGAPFLAPVPPPMQRSQSIALMIVGGAGLVVGSLIDGDTGTIIMAGGGVVGLVGLFHYLR